MVQSLIEDRFRFKFHRESKELPVYELAVAKNGPKSSRQPTMVPEHAVSEEEKSSFNRCRSLFLYTLWRGN